MKLKRNEIRELEAACEQAIENVLSQEAADLADGVSPETFHLMAKAAVTVLEAALTGHSGVHRCE